MPRFSPTALTSCLRAGVAFLVLSAAGCGMGTDAGSTTALLTSLPRCDDSLLHPRITVGSAAVLPGKLIVFVDGVMACVDEAARVDQLITQVEGRTPPLTK